MTKLFNYILFIFCLFGWEQQISADTKSIKIGAILHLTGDQAMQGEAFREGIELAVENIDKNNTLNGKSLKIIFEDSMLSPKNAHAASKKLISVDKVTASINASFLETMATGKEFEISGTPAITLWDSSPQIENLGNFIFAIGIWTPSAGVVSAQYSYNELNAKTAVIINTQNEWSLSVSQFYKNEFEKLGGKVIEEISLNPTTKDFRSVFTKIKSKLPDILYTPVTDGVITFYKQLKQSKIKIPIVTSDIINQEHILASPRTFEGIYQTQALDPQNQSAAEFKSLYKQKFNKEPTQLLLSSWGYDAVQLLAIAISKCDTDRTCIKDELYKVKDFDGASGTISFTSKGSAPTMERIFKITDQQLKFVG